MFTPRYVITNQLLADIKKIDSLITRLNSSHFPKVVLAELERRAVTLSAHASTSIEGNPLPLTEVKIILRSTPRNIRRSEQEVLNYNQALLKLNNRLKRGLLPLTLSSILSTHKQIMFELQPKTRLGKLRQEPVFVYDPKTGQPVYLPPDANDVRPLTNDLIEFINRSRGIVDPLILAGIFHRQMIIIHPFMDGNGRTSRLLTKMLLAQMGLNTFNLFSFENYYNQDVTRYFQTVGVFGNFYEISGQIDFSRWLEYFVEGIMDELIRVQELLPQIPLTPSGRLRTHHLKMLKFIQEKGFITNRDYARLISRAKATRNLDFNELIELGLLERKGRGKATYYIFSSAHAAKNIDVVE